MLLLITGGASRHSNSNSIFHNGWTTNEAKGGHSNSTFHHSMKWSESTSSCHLEWSKATCFQLRWGYKILVVKYYIGQKIELELKYFGKTSKKYMKIWSKNWMATFAFHTEHYLIQLAIWKIKLEFPPSDSIVNPYKDDVNLLIDDK